MVNVSDKTGSPFSPNEPGARGLAGLIEAQVERTPAAPAVKCDDRIVTYRELNAAANRLAHWLIRRDVRAEEAVGVCLARSVEMIVAVLAIVKAGGAYLPLDPSYPAERLQFMQADSQPRLVLTQRARASRLAAGEAVCLDDSPQAHDSESSDDPDVSVPPDSLAYLIYTSGSTGQPKAVAMEQGPLCNLLLWQMNALPGAITTLQFASLNFDVSFQEIFATLATGGTLVLVDEAIRRDPQALLKLIDGAQIGRLFMPFVALQNLAATAEVARSYPARLREVITAGEQLRITPQIREFFARLERCTLHNHYGPTESHVVTAHTLSGDPAHWPSVAPIGRPIDGAIIRLLDEAMNAVPPGEAGEIYIGGRCLARGYFRRTDLTAGRFVRDPISADPGARLYRSGDRARMGADGVLEFLGRNDDQIKVRGVRIEPGEVDAALSQHPAIQQAAVAAHDHAGQGSRLVAYYVVRAGQGVSRGELRNFLSAKLPAPSLPSAYVALDRMPLTPSGKVDRLALPPPSLQHTEQPVPAKADLEKQLVALWEEALDTRPVGIGDDFSELGGDSLLAAQLALAIEKNCGIRVPVGKFYELPTIEALAKYFSQGSNPDEESDVVPLNAAGTKPPLFSVLGSLNVGRLLGADQPFFQMLASVGSDSPLERTTSAENAIRELAEHCISTIRQIQPHGPYRLSGYSFGGIVAFEIAHLLHAQGEEIAFLGLIDPDPPRPSRVDLLKREIHKIGIRAALSQQVGRVRSRAERWLKRAGGREPAHLAPSANDIPYREMPAEKKVFHFFGHYRAPACPCHFHLFLAKDHYENQPHKPLSDPRLDWIKVAANGSEVHVIPGNHVTINEEPNVRILADLLCSSLAKVFSIAALLPLDARASIEFLAAC